MAEPALKYRTFWRRFWAGWIDGLILMPLAWIDSAVWASVSAPALLVVWFIAHSLSWAAYSITLHGLYGQTIGKRLMSVTVVHTSGSRLSMRQAVLRDSVILFLVIAGFFSDLPTVASGQDPYGEGATLGVAQWISLYATFAWFLIELVTMLSNDKRRALHDYIAGSVVVRTAVADSREPAGA